MERKRERKKLHWKCSVLRPELPDGRLIAVSDIHGNLPFFLGLLEQLKLQAEDTLILLGDMLEKGAESLALMEYIMELEQRARVISVCGNCDGLVLRFFEGDEWDDGFFSWYLTEHPECTICQMAHRIGMDGWESLDGLRAALRVRFARHWAWLKGLPTVLETEHLFFVHGGIAREENLEELDAWQCMKFDNFWGQNLSFSKYVVVGHWPVTLYRPELPSAAPIFDRARKILSIDGGCVLKLDGQLNALVFPREDSEDFYWVAYDGLERVRALDDQHGSEQPINIRWGRSELEVLEAGEEFSLCRHLESGRVLKVLSRFLHRDGVRVWCEDSTDYLLPVERGDILSVSERVDGGILAKKDGVTGWYFGAYTECSSDGI